MQEKPVSAPLPPLPLNAEGISKIVLITLIGGIGPGILMAAQTRLFYLIVVYPILMTIGTGLLVAVCVISFGIKNRPVIAVWTLLVGLLMYGSYRTTDYFLTLQKLSNQTGHSISLTFTEYLNQRAAAGLPIASLGDGDGPIIAGAALSWIYWTAELLLICGGATIITTRGLAGAFDG